MDTTIRPYSHNTVFRAFIQPKSNIKTENKKFNDTWNKVVNIAPILSLAGSLVMIFSGKNENLSRLGQKILGAGTIFTSINGIGAGVITGQPSMIFNNVLMLPQSILLATAKNNFQRSIANALSVALGGLYTIGFANELENKSTKINNPRKYDFKNFKLKNLPKELFNITKFTIEDHIKLLKEIPKIITNLPKDLTSDLTKPNADLSKFGALMSYIGALPILFLGSKNPKIVNSKFVQITKAIAMITANLTLFNIALQRKDIKGKAPLLGVPLTVIGTALAKDSFTVGLSNLGEAIDNVFFSDMAANGLQPITKE